MPSINPIFPPILIPIGCLIVLEGGIGLGWLRRQWIKTELSHEQMIVRDYLVACFCLIVLGLFCIFVALVGQ